MLITFLPALNLNVAEISHKSNKAIIAGTMVHILVQSEDKTLPQKGRITKEEVKIQNTIINVKGKNGHMNFSTPTQDVVASLRMNTMFLPCISRS